MFSLENIFLKNIFRKQSLFVRNILGKNFQNLSRKIVFGDFFTRKNVSKNNFSGKKILKKVSEIFLEKVSRKKVILGKILSAKNSVKIFNLEMFSRSKKGNHFPENNYFSIRNFLS